MAQDGADGRLAAVDFTGRRGTLFGILLRGYLLMVPTLGIYRFWLATWKRRFYWSNTVIDGDPLEYTGTPLQLLVGFLFALAIFLPLYLLFFYLSTQNADVVLLGYAAVGTIFWFMMGYAIYRARDFRLSRTLWRGIRFDQGGSAWIYALRRFLWSILMILTLGLVYPFMAVSLWRYRCRNTWYGDRQASFAGSWKQLAGPYYLGYFVAVACLVATVVVGSASGAFVFVEGFVIPSAPVVGMALLSALVIGLFVCAYQAREISRMYSSMRLGDAILTVKIRGRSLFGLYLRFGACLLALVVALNIAGAVVIVVLVRDGDFDLGWVAGIFANQFTSFIPLLAYLFAAAVLSLLAELFISYGFWRLVARNAAIAGVESLRSVRARQEDDALAGEGLADALNVGAY